MEKDKLIQAIQEFNEIYKSAVKNYEVTADTWWDSLAYDDKLLAFYSVVKRIYDGEIKQQGSYRYVLYDVFGFGPDAYGIGMDCGYLSLHNAIKTDAEQLIIDNHYKTGPECENI